MFRIIGGDSRQYGPVSAEELQQWIKLGRAGPQTQAQRDGETEWKPLSSFAEFADAFSGAAPAGTPAIISPPAFSSPTPPDPDRLAEEAMNRSDGVDIGGALGRGWDVLKADFWPIVGISALVMLILSAAGIIAGPLIGGWQWYFLKKIRGQPAEMNDAFSGFSTNLLALFLGLLVSSLLTGVGMMLCIIPGIYLAVAWQFTLLLIVDQKLEFWPAMEVSRKVITKNWWAFLGFAIITWLLNMAGALCCGVGMFITFPWTALALVFLYENRFGAGPLTRPSS